MIFIMQPKAKPFFIFCNLPAAKVSGQYHLMQIKNLELF
jgi:hypothetical protein